MAPALHLRRLTKTFGALRESSRVVEVLLAAVSPFELMAGKLLGQLAVGLLVMGLSIGLGLAALYSFAILGLVDPLLVIYLLVFFLITYVVFGAMMLTIGAAVNLMHGKPPDVRTLVRWAREA